MAILAAATLLSPAAGANPDAVLGRYWSPERDGQIEVFRRGDRYFGRIVWERGTGEGHVGEVFMEGFVYDGAGHWVDGRVVSPRDGTAYHARLWLDDTGDLRIRGYVAVPLLGRTMRFERTADEPPGADPEIP